MKEEVVEGRARVGKDAGTKNKINNNAETKLVK